ncbi:hypothetical protein [Lysinibacillus contaminans]|uniref:hypothetical protein n=1 Tax=Lysinibacillus contaminans TaxID=1293441 RepID=UPI000AF3B486|nr:hypothetical protein [Lysinibacillus contaminans]
MDYPLLFSEITAIQYVEFIHKLYEVNFQQSEYIKISEEFNFYKYTEYKISSLSLGNRQKVVIITGLLLNLPLFVLDEPLVGLDVESVEVFQMKIEEYCRKGGTVVFSSHLLDIVKKFCHYALILHNKTIHSKVKIDENFDIHKKFFEVIANE